MNYHEKTINLIEVFGIQPKKINEILGLKYAAYKKLNQINGNKFSEDDFKKISEYYKINITALD